MIVTYFTILKPVFQAVSTPTYLFGILSRNMIYIPLPCTLRRGGLHTIHE